MRELIGWSVLIVLAGGCPASWPGPARASATWRRRRRRSAKAKAKEGSGHARQEGLHGEDLEGMRSRDPRASRAKSKRPRPSARRRLRPTSPSLEKLGPDESRGAGGAGDGVAHAQEGHATRAAHRPPSSRPSAPQRDRETPSVRYLLATQDPVSWGRAVGARPTARLAGPKAAQKHREGCPRASSRRMPGAPGIPPGWVR